MNHRESFHVHFFIAMLLSVLFPAIQPANAQRYMEKLDRGLIAVKINSGYFLSWRLFGTEPLDDSFGFNVYKGTTRLNSSVITEATSYQDNSGGSGTYTVKPVTDGTEGDASEPALVLERNYHSIPLDLPRGYSANDASCGDLDGDGQYEIVLHITGASRDNSQSGVTDAPILDAYTLDGTRMWRINLGTNIREGAHYTQFMVYDLDGDGSAEIACKTAPGSKDATGEYLKLGPAASANHTTSYVRSDGYITTGPEYYTIFSGLTGEELATVDYIPPRGDLSGWGGIGGNAGNDNGTNRAERYLACVAYLDGVRPSVIACRGYYGRSVLAAWDWRDGELTNRWTFDSENGDNPYSGMGNHSLSVGDVDQDGRDEIVYGSMCVDDDGEGLYTTMLRHGDANHLGDLDPDRPGLEMFGIHENEAVIEGLPGFGAALFDAKDGTIIYGWNKNVDIGRGCADNMIDTKGCQCWWNSGPGLVSCKTGERVGGAPNSCNFLCWWDGDLMRELLNGTSVSKYGGGTLLSASGCTANNGTKSTPCLSADIFGDWREEVIFSCGGSLRIYTTTTPTTNHMYTLMHDPGYRLSIAWQNVGYNQPPHTGFYFGYGMTMPPPKPDIRYYGETSNAEPAVQEASCRRQAGSMKVYSGNMMVLSKTSGTVEKTVTIYDCSGRSVLSIVTAKASINLADFGICRGVYLARID